MNVHIVLCLLALAMGIAGLAIVVYQGWLIVRRAPNPLTGFINPNIPLGNKIIAASFPFFGIPAIVAWLTFTGIISFTSTLGWFVGFVFITAVLLLITGWFKKRK